MKKFLMVLLAVILVVGCFSTASAEWMYVTGNANVRQYPGITTSVLGVVSQGDWVDVINEIHTVDGRIWCQVIWNNQDGYISKANLSATASQNYSYETNFTFRTLADVNVREYANIGSTVIRVIKKGVTVYGSRLFPDYNGDIWLEVEVSSDVYGYIHLSNLELTQSNCNFKNISKLGSVMHVTGDTINMRTNSDINSESFKILKKNQYVYVAYFVCTYDGEAGRIWAYCHDDDMNYGFVSCLYLSK